MNIVHLQLSGGFGGIAVLTNEISKISEHNNIFYFLFEGGCVADDMAKHSPVHIENGSHGDFLGEAIKFTKFCKENNADVIISHTGAPIVRFIGAFAKTMLGKKVKFLLYWHSNAQNFSYKNKIKNLFQLFIEKTAFKKCTCAVAISKSVKESFADKFGFDRNKIRVVYNGIDIDRFSFSPCRNREVFNIIYVGRVFYQKGVHLLVKAMACIPEDYNVHLNIVGAAVESGADDYIRRVNGIIEKHALQNRVTLCGEQNNVDEWLAKSSLFVHPAILHEGFGLTLAEAMARGVPCVSFNKGAMPEIIEHGKNGFIAEEETPECLAEYIKKAYSLWRENESEYMKMCAAARETAVKFSVENTKNQLESLYI